MNFRFQGALQAWLLERQCGDWTRDPQEKHLGQPCVERGTKIWQQDSQAQYSSDLGSGMGGLIPCPEGMMASVSPLGTPEDTLGSFS